VITASFSAATRWLSLARIASSFALISAVCSQDGPFGVLFAFGLAMIVCGFVYRTPIPVQPVKAVGGEIRSNRCPAYGH
jgi:hypothetical protein